MHIYTESETPCQLQNAENRQQGAKEENCARSAAAGRLFLGSEPARAASSGTVAPYEKKQPTASAATASFTSHENEWEATIRGSILMNRAFEIVSGSGPISQTSTANFNASKYPTMCNTAQAATNAAHVSTPSAQAQATAR